MLRELHRGLIMVLAVFLLAIVLLLVWPPGLTARGTSAYIADGTQVTVPDAKIRCSSALAVGMPDNVWLNDPGSPVVSRWHDRFPSDLDLAIRREMISELRQECTDRQLTRSRGPCCWRYPPGSSAPC